MFVRWHPVFVDVSAIGTPKVNRDPIWLFVDKLHMSAGHEWVMRNWDRVVGASPNTDWPRRVEREVYSAHRANNYFHGVTIMF